MKKYYILASLSLLSVMSCAAADLSLYKNLRPIDTAVVNQPTITEVKGLPYGVSYVLLDDKGNSVPSQSQTIRTSKVIPPVSVEACTSTCKDAPSLADGDERTTFDFPISSSGAQKGKITITYAKPLVTDSLMFRTTRDSYVPTAFTLTIDGKRTLNTLSGTSARFPRMEATKVEIEFEYNQPIRFTEVGVGSVTEEVVSNSLRFVYQPGAQYVLYFDSPSGGESIPGPSINLFAKEPLLVASLGVVSKNPAYKERDTDVDDVPDSVDNCPMQANKDQKDSNNDGVGDVCDDYDYDGVMTYRDNCPAIVNPDQRDTDKDGMGDACDNEESRLTEKYTWVPWVVFALVFIAVLGMGYEVLRKKQV